MRPASRVAHVGTKPIARITISRAADERVRCILLFPLSRRNKYCANQYRRPGTFVCSAFSVICGTRVYAGFTPRRTNQFFSEKTGSF